MSLYQRLFARAMACGDDGQHDLYGERKRLLFDGLQGTVLEIGPGSGVNLPYYPAGIRWIGAEPNLHMHPYIRKQAEALSLEIDLRATSADALDLDDASVDAVVSTLVLCSVPDVAAVLCEVQRVLRPGGRFVFIEHVAAPEGTWLRRLQRGIRPVWRWLADGCRPDRETPTLLAAAGFSDLVYEPFNLPGLLPVIKPHIIGTATRPG